MVKKLTFAFFLTILSGEIYAGYDLHSMAVYEDFGKDYFVVSIHTEKGKKLNNLFDKNVKRRLELRIIADKFLARKFAKIWVNGLVINCDRNELNQNSQYIVDFSTIFRMHLNKGDIIDVESLPESGVTVRINNTVARQFDDVVIFNLLLRVLVGDVPLNSQVKYNILKRKITDIPQSLTDLHNKLAPSSKREDDTSTWIMRSLYAKKEYKQQYSSAQLKTRTTISLNPPTKSSLSITSKDKKVETVVSDVKNKPSSETKAPSETVAYSNINKASDEVSLENKSAKLNNKAPNTYIENVDSTGIFTVKSILAQRKYAKSVTRWLKKNTSSPLLMTSKSDKRRMRVSLTVDRSGKLLEAHVREKAKNPAINKQIMKTLKKASPYPEVPQEIFDETIDVDVFFGLHWRYKYGG